MESKTNTKTSDHLMTHLVIGTTSPLRITPNRNARLKIKRTCWKAPEGNQVMRNNWGSAWRSSPEVSPVWRCRVSPGARGWRFQVRGQRWDSALLYGGVLASLERTLKWAWPGCREALSGLWVAPDYLHSSDCIEVVPVIVPQAPGRS